MHGVRANCRFTRLSVGMRASQELFAIGIDSKILSFRPIPLDELLGVGDVYFIRTNV